jgi:hypothetical protein
VPVYVRIVYDDITQTSFRTEQSISKDGGKTWAINSRQTFTRRSPLPADPVDIKTNDPDHQHDFDFEFGSWRVHLRRLLHPLTGSTTWVELNGTSVLHPLWNGRANVGELEVANTTTAIEGLSLRLYDPATQQWNIYFANGRGGRLGMPPQVGRFTNGRGEFYDQELLDGKSIFVRFVFDDATRNSFRFVQSFSADAGRTWEPNWIATFQRTSARS